MIAALHIQTKLRDGITYLKKGYCTPPFKIMDVRENKKDSTLHLMLMSSSPGILDGDKYSIKIELEEGTQLRLSTQSFQRLFTMDNGASHQLEAHLGKGSYFSYIPHPVVPHDGSSFTAGNKIYLSDNCSLLWGEILTCGRKGNGEVFRFSKYHNVTEVYMNGRLVIKENLLIVPGTTNVHAIGQLEGHTHQASLIYLEETAYISALKQAIGEFLSAQDNVTYGITAAQKNGLMIRILGFRGEQLYSCTIAIASIIAAAKQQLVVV